MSVGPRLAYSDPPMGWVLTTTQNGSLFVDKQVQKICQGKLVIPTTGEDSGSWRVDPPRLSGSLL